MFVRRTVQYNSTGNFINSILVAQKFKFNRISGLCSCIHYFNLRRKQLHVCPAFKGLYYIHTNDLLIVIQHLIGMLLTVNFFRLHEMQKRKNSLCTEKSLRKKSCDQLIKGVVHRNLCMLVYQYVGFLSVCPIFLCQVVVIAEVAKGIIRTYVVSGELSGNYAVISICFGCCLPG